MNIWSLWETIIYPYLVVFFMVGYYDLVLVLIPGSLIGITGLLYGSGLGLTLAVPPAAVVAVILIGHALFVRAPVGDVPSRRATTPAVQPAD